MHAGLWDTGEWGASVFFMLSGFLMMKGYYDREGFEISSVKECALFSVRKIKSLYPLHIITMLLAAAYMIFDKVVNNALEKSYIMHIAKTMVLCIPLLQTWIPKMYVAFALNGPSWYLSVSLFLYAAFPLLLRVFRKKLNMKNAGILMLSIFAIQLLAGYIIGRLNMPEGPTNEWSKWFTYIFPVYRLGDFAIGCIAGYIFINRKKEVSPIAATIKELFAIAAAAFSIIAYQKLGGGNYEWFRYTELYLPSSLLLVYVFAVNGGYITRLLTNRALIWIGDMSPYAFLIHQIVICWFNYILRSIFGDVSILILAGANLGITLALSWLVSKIKNNRHKKPVRA